MQNDITSAKKFRDEYFIRLGHGMNEHTVISLMLEYAASVNVNSERIDTSALLQDNENLKGELKLNIDKLEFLERQNKELNELLIEKEQKLNELKSSTNVDNNPEEIDVSESAAKKRTPKK